MKLYCAVIHCHVQADDLAGAVQELADTLLTIDGEIKLSDSSLGLIGAYRLETYPHLTNDLSISEVRHLH